MSYSSRLPQVISLGFLLLLIYVFTSVVVKGRHGQQLQQPSVQERAESLSFAVALPPIAELSHYYGQENDTWAPYNPFVPLQSRLRDIALVKNPPPKVSIIPKPRLQRKRPLPAEPRIAPLDLAARKLPKIVGGLSQGREPFVLALYNQELLTMGVGQVIGNWSLVRIEGNSAWFIPLDGGDELRVPIGMARGSTAMKMNKTASSLGGAGSRPRLDQLLQDRPDLLEQIQRNPERAEGLIRQALEETAVEP